MPMINIIDFHTHILPCMDDGSSGVAESIEMLKLQANHGITHVVTTPHFYANQDNPHHFLKKRETSFKKLQSEILNYSDLPKITVGAEVYYFNGISEWEGLKEMAISGTNCVMIEMPTVPWSKKMITELGDIPYKQGLTPIIAHIDRYISPFKTKGIPKILAEIPVYIQANSSFFTNKFTTPLAFKLLKNNQIHLLGSDCHNMDSRPPDLHIAVEKIIRKKGDEFIEKINLIERDIFAIK